MIQFIKDKFFALRHHWMYSDSQPTEITLALVNLILAPVATYMELGFMWFYQLCLITSAIYQSLCIANGDLHCRVRAALFTFGLFMSTTIMYIDCIGLPTPSHWGWVLLTFSSFGSLRRLKREEINRYG